MARIIDRQNNRDLGEVTDPNLLAYYLGEGYEIGGLSDARAVVVAHDATHAEVLTLPAKSAAKAVWQEYARAVDPAKAAEIEDMTRDELIDHYGA